MRVEKINVLLTILLCVSVPVLAIDEATEIFSEDFYEFLELIDDDVLWMMMSDERQYVSIEQSLAEILEGEEEVDE